ncbi:MAG: cytochrome c oxidase subunit II [SAR202 cluster bacterium Casp-Chloro-G3]|nr:MAG: cytochrome c oxidase subunit II [SAR202 cluster bacterium Casp-Chloro-G3]
MLLSPPDRADSPAQVSFRRFPMNNILKSTKQWFQGKHLLALGILALSLVLVACDANAKQSTFGTAGPVAEKQLLLFNVLMWVMVAVFVLVEGALLYAAIRFRRRPGQPLPKQTHGNTVLELTWTIIPTILILGLGIWSVTTLFELDKPPASAAGNTLDVTVTGHQWWFEFEYPNADGNGTVITTANELRVPVGRAVEVLLQSDDVIHSFWIPKLAGKVDMVPTRNNRLWFLADETGTFYGQCAEFCGTAHAQMKFLVQVLTQEEYDAWVAGFGQTPQLSAAAQAGQQVFNGAGGCVVCHTVNGSDNPAIVAGRMQGFLNTEVGIAPGPNMTDLATRQTFAAGLIDLNRENLRVWLTNPEDIKPGNHMASRATIYQTADGRTSLTQTQVSALIEYLLSLK